MSEKTAAEREMESTDYRESLLARIAQETADEILSREHRPAAGENSGSEPKAE